MTLPELIKEYNLTFVNGERMYIINLDTNNMIFENTTPFYFRYLENEIYCNSWKNLLPSIFKIFNEINPKTNEELLCIKNTWGKQDVFSTIKLSNYIEVENGVFMNCNHTAIHAFNTIQLLSNEYHVNSSDCLLVIKRQPSAEPGAVKEYFKNESIKKFKAYLKYVKNISESSIDIIVKNVESINKNFLQKISKGYNDFFLIENPSTFFNYMVKTNDEIKKFMRYPEKVKNAIYRQLNYLYDFIRVDRKKRMKEMPSFLVDTSENIEEDTTIDNDLLKYLDIDDLI